MDNPFVHHVFFWLKNPDNAADLAALIAGLEKMKTIETISYAHIGKPAGTSREVIDGSYQVSWLTFFKTPADQDSYQIDPRHKDFIAACSHLWSRVLVYDSVGM